MTLAAFTLFHVLLSLIGIGAGFIVVFGLLTAKRYDGWTLLFLASTLATSLTGFLFPYHGFQPSYLIGVLSIIALGFAILARYTFHLSGTCRAVYVVNAIMALYFNVFVLVVQCFTHIPALKALAPTQSEPPFVVAQLIILTVFIVIGVLALKTWRFAELHSMDMQGPLHL
jgi:hypothetical protein